MLGCISHMTISTVVSCVMNVWKLSCPTSADRASLFTEHKMSGLPIRARYKHSNAILKQKVLQLIQVLPSWHDGHPSKDLTLCIIALSFDFPIRNVFPGTFQHVLPGRRTTPLFLREVVPTLVFCTSSRKQQLYSVCINVECIPSIHDQEIMLVD